MAKSEKLDGSEVARWEKWESSDVASWRFLVMLIALAKSRSMKGASHQPAFMSGCLSISHMCLVCLPSEQMLF